MTMADTFIDNTTKVTPHHEVKSGGLGIVIGSLIAGPLGAIVGGSLGVMNGHQQSQNDSLNDQKNVISELENELSLKMAALSNAQDINQQSLTTINTLKTTMHNAEQHYNENVIQFVESYQLDLYFMTNSNDMTDHAQHGLKKLAKLLAQNENVHANIESHSDWRGSDDINCALAAERLGNVVDYLTQVGSNQSQLLTTNYGEHANLNEGAWGEELFYDRRVTITLSYFE